MFRLRICFQRVRPVGQLEGCCSSRGLHCFIWHACGKCFEKMAFNFYQGKKYLQIAIFIKFFLKCTVANHFVEIWTIHKGKRSIWEGSAE